MNEPQYWIAQGENVQGPFGRQQVLAWIDAGKVRADMLFSRDGGDWVAGHELPELFAPAAPAAAPPPPVAPAFDDAPPARSRGRHGRSAARSRRHDYDDYDDEPRGRPARRGGKPKPPGAVMTVVILDFISAALYGFAGVASFLLVAAAKKEGEGGGLTNIVLFLGLVALVMAALYLLLGILIKGGSSGARVAQILLSGLGILMGLGTLVQGEVDISSIIGLAINILIVVLLLGRDASAFFTAASGMTGRRRPRTVGGGGGGGRGRRRRRY